MYGRMDENKMKAPTNRQLLTADGNIDRDWYLFFSYLGNTLEQITRSGTSAQRPTERVFIGMPFYDITLNKDIYVRSVSPIVWRDSTGTAV